MSDLKLISLLLMSLFYFVAGISHFRKPKFFISITPEWVPFPKSINLITGIIEIILSIGLLFSYSRNYAVLGLIALLIAVFPANIYHFRKAKKKKKHITSTLLRLPVQVVLIYWAYIYLK
ncbi:MAG: DoxX family protein [Cryomorphaceae bacterium BACL29 MAG-121220-bin8]|jgi:uncharacterized membrane protein|nr:MAG: DoxX family protein [Cryomorphaceae bacterium BACL29 MAG-121220-bin8]